MRLDQLRLIAFGGFRGHTLDLSGHRSGFHLIYGNNEAGKSTALRAIEGLFFGIPHVTTDAYEHRTHELRIGARLIADDGRTLEIVRRKGRTKTLLDPDDRVVDEAELQRLLGGVGRDLFQTVFGLNHDTLRSGADALLRANGNAEEALFETGLGVTGLGRVLHQLKDEADALFTPLAKKKPLNIALRGYQDALRKTRFESTAPQAYLDQIQAVETARRDAAEADGEHRRLSEALHAKRRALRVLPLLAQRQREIAMLAEIGPALPVPVDATSRRENAERSIQEADLRLARRKEELEQVESQRSKLPEPNPEQQSEEVKQHADAVAQLTGADRADRGRDLLAKELRDIEVRIRVANDNLAPEQRVAAQSATEGQHQAPQKVARIHALIREGGLLVARANEFTNAQTELDRERAELQDELEHGPTVIDVSELSALRSEAQKKVGLVDRLEILEAEAQKAADLAEQSLRKLGDRITDVSALGPPVSNESVSQFGRGFDALAHQKQSLKQEQVEVTQERERVLGELAELEAGGPLPSFDELIATRADRDACLDELARVSGPVEPALVRRLDLGMRKADAVADRLRDDAARVAAQIRLKQKSESTAKRLARVDAALLEVDDGLSKLDEEYQTLLAKLPTAHLDPPALLDWLSRREVALEAAQVAAARASKAEETRSALGRLTEELRRAVSSASPEKLSARLDLPATIALADTLERQAIDRMKLRSSNEEALRRANRQRERLIKECADADAAVATWRIQWASAVAPLGLNEHATFEEAESVVNQLLALFALDEERRALAVRIGDLDEELSNFAKRMDEHGISGADLLERGRRWVQKLEQRVADHAESRELFARSTALSSEIAELSENRELALRELASLFETVGVEDAPALMLAEKREADRKLRLSALREVEQQLLSIGDGTTIEAMVQETADLQPDALSAEVETLQEAVEESDDQRKRMQRDIGTREAGVAKFHDERAVAADAAGAAQEHLAKIARQSLAYARLRIAATVLEQAMESYREQHQDPVLEAASVYFHRMTLGTYQKVVTGWNDDDTPVLRCEASNGDLLDVAALSDGTRDQLYLSLRLATLERRLLGAEPMPLVLDDILVHFDDHRAKETLAILGELSERVQVLFFTHHQRLRELARSAIDATRLSEHELPSG